MDTSNGNKWKKNPASAALQNKRKVNASTSYKLKPGLRSSKQKKLLTTEKYVKSINKIAIKKNITIGKSQPNIVSKKHA